MKVLPRTFFAFMLATLICLPHPSLGLDLTGAWVTDGAACQKVFVKKGKGAAFRPQSELHGSGFIIDGNAIRGKAAKCAIKTKREDGQVIHLIAACATDIMLSNTQFSLRVVNDNKLVRIFPGMEGMELAYDRCSL